MLLSLITQNEYRSLRLPERREGVFTLTDPLDGRTLFLLSGSEKGWTVRETSLGRLSKGDPVELISGMLLHVRIRENMEQALLYMEEASQFYAKFARCMVPDQIEYQIGSADDCDLVCNNIQISPHHCLLACRNRVWTIQDQNSAVGTCVNGKRIASPRILEPGDVVSVLNQKFIVLPGLLAFNGQNIDPAQLKGKFMLLNVPRLPMEKPLSKELPRVYFRRKPRYLQSVYESDIFEIQAPPDPRTAANTNPALLTMAPTIVSGLAMLAGGLTNPVSGLGMLASSLIFPQISRKRNEKLLQEEEEKRKQVYSQYLEKLNREMEELVSKQAETLKDRNPDPRIEAQQILQDPHGMWARRPEQADFLDIRLGIGTLPTMVKLKFPEQDPFDDDEDPMQKKLLDFQNKKWELRNVPIMLPLHKFYSVGLAGPGTLPHAFAAFMLTQLAMHIGCDDMKLCLLGELNEDLEPLRWLPHTWDIQNSVHLTAANKEEMLHLVPDLDQLLSAHSLKTADKEEKRPPEIIILITNEDLAHSGVLTRLLFDKEYKYVHILILSNHSADLPSRTSLTMGLRKDAAKMVWQDEGKRAVMSFIPDPSDPDLIRQLSGLMANTFLDILTETRMMPANFTFLEMFGVSSVEHLNILSRWENSDPVRSLATPLGISEDGDLCILNLHQKADGPHGLIAGTTGSGKSELIIAYILSMAVNYSPEDVSFVLIDYKGGDMANAFENLPHTAGIITNLDGNELNRSLMSINSELQRRQRIFADAKRALGNIQIDIYKYQQQYRRGKVSEPVPHLFIIADEFAELKMEQPDFMQELIRTARIGRSLGVHLILATQKPSGVVDDQIWSNTNFRICMRVQDGRDSHEIIKAPDAALLTAPGSFYKQVGYGTNLVKAQSGYTGEDYDPEASVIPDCGIDVLDNIGNVIRHEALPKVRKADTPTQLKVVTDYITALGKREHLAAGKLWEPPLEQEIPIGTIYERYEISADPWAPEPVFADADDPARQRRFPLRIPLSAGNNALIYGAIGSGKFMLLNTVVEDLLEHHNADQLNLYILDYGDDGFHVYKDAPQVGDVFFSDDEEKLRRFLSMMENQIRIRKKAMGGSAASAPMPERLKNAGMPNIIVILHQLLTIQEHLGDDLERLMRILKDGPRWGIVFIATLESSTGVRYQLIQRFAWQAVLQMDHPDDYTSILGRTNGMKPSAIKGRGLIRAEDTLHEFQTASSEKDPLELCEELRAGWAGTSAPAIRVMPETITWEDMTEYIDPARILRLPIGLDTETIEPVFYPFDSRPVHLLLGRPEDTERFLQNLLPLADRSGLEIQILDSSFNFPGSEASADNEDISAIVKAMHMDCRKMFTENDPATIEARKHRLIVIPSVQKIWSRLDMEAMKFLRAMLDLVKTRPAWKWTFLLCDNIQNIGKLRYDPDEKSWFQSSVSTEDVIWLGAGINLQSVIQVNSSAMLRQNIAYPLGYLIRTGNAERVHFLG